MEKLRTIKLYGPLARFGRTHQFVCVDTAGAIRAMCSMVPGFESFMLSSKEKGLGFACFLGKKNLSEDQLTYPAGDDEIRIAPIVLGSGRGGLFSIILGVALVGAAFFTGGTSIAAWSALQTGLGVAGVAMVLTGVSQFLVKQPKGLVAADKENKESYNFNGVVNTTAQGNPVPVCYGELIVGSVVGGGDMYSEDLQA